MIKSIAVVLVLFAIYAYRADFEKYCIFTTGVFKRVSRNVVHTKKQCCDPYCEQQIQPGERRRWYKEVVIAGMPTIRFGGGVHHYCEDHVAFEIRDEADQPITSTVERIPTPIFELLIALEEWHSGHLNVENRRSQGGIGQAKDCFNSSMGLLSIMFLVVVAAVTIRLRQFIRNG